MMRRANKYANAPAGTRAKHRRLGEARDLTAAIVRHSGHHARMLANRLWRIGASPCEIKARLWEPLRIRAELLTYGRAIIVQKSEVGR